MKPRSDSARLLLGLVCLYGLLVAVRPAFGQTLAVVANSGNDTVSVIDVGTHVVAGTITLSPGSGPSNIAIDAQRGVGYVTDTGQDACYVSNSMVSLIDLRTRSLVGNVPVGAGPLGIALSPDGRAAYIGNFCDTTVSVIDTQKGVVVATVAVDGNPFGVAVTPDGRLVYVATTNGDFPSKIDVVDAATNSILTNIDDSQPLAVAAAPDGATVYAASLLTSGDTAQGMLLLIDTATNVVAKTIDLPMVDQPTSVAVTPDGATVYVGDHNGGNVAVIDTSTNTVTATIPRIGVQVGGLAVTPDGSAVYATNYANDASSVSVIDTAANTVTATIPVGRKPLGIAIASLASLSPTVTATPTQTPTVTAMATAPPMTTATTAPSSGGGCAIGPEVPSGSLLLMGFLVLGFWRRRRSVRARGATRADRAHRD